MECHSPQWHRRNGHSFSKQLFFKKELDTWKLLGRGSTGKVSILYWQFQEFIWAPIYCLIIFNCILALKIRWYNRELSVSYAFLFEYWYRPISDSPYYLSGSAKRFRYLAILFIFGRMKLCSGDATVVKYVHQGWFPG